MKTQTLGQIETSWELQAAAATQSLDSSVRQFPGCAPRCRLPPPIVAPAAECFIISSDRPQVRNAVGIGQEGKLLRRDISFSFSLNTKKRKYRKKNYSTVWPEYLQQCVTGWLVEGNRYCGKTYKSHLQRYLRSVTVKSLSADPPSIIGKAVVFGEREPFVLVIVCQ